MFDAARGASFEDEADAGVFAVGFAAPQGFSGGGCLRLRSAFFLSALLRRGDEKWSVILSFGSEVFLGGRVSALLMECCRVALSNVSGEGVSGMVVQSSSRMYRHLGAIGRSQSGVVLMVRFIFSQ